MHANDIDIITFNYPRQDDFCIYMYVYRNISNIWEKTDLL